MRVLVTGADGFVGRAACLTLLEEGFEARAAVRRIGKSTTWLPPDVTVVRDIVSDPKWAEALDDVDVVVHLAGRAHELKDPQGEFRRVNAYGTRSLARMAADTGVKRFVYISSIGVHGRATHERPFTEEDPPSPHGAYAISKWEAEQALHQVAAESGLEVVILRPPLMYGPYVKANFLRLMRLVDRMLLLPLDSIDNLRSLLYVHNLASAIIVCIDRPEAAGEVFLISDGENVSTPELIRRIAQVLERPVYLSPFPPHLIRAAGRLVGKSAMVERLLASLVVDDSKIRRVLGWQPPYTLTEGLRETALWFKGSFM